MTLELSPGGLLGQATLCLALGWFGSWWWRGHAARAHQALRLGLLAAGLLPGLFVVVRGGGLGLLPAPPVQEGGRSRVVARLDTAAAPVPVPVTPAMPETLPPMTPRPGHPRGDVPWVGLGVGLWMLGSVLLLLRLARTFVRGRRIVAASRPCRLRTLRGALGRARAALGVTRPVSLRWSPVAASPMIWCWRRRPILLVPAETEPQVDWEGVFRHELAHWRRADHRTALHADLWACLLWWHPLVWIVKRRLETLSEQVCDDWALVGGRSGADYAASLLDLRPAPRVACVPSIVGKEKTMRERIERIVKHRDRDPRAGMRWTLAVGLLAGSLVVGTAFAQRRPDRPERSGVEAVAQARADDIHERLEDRVRVLHELEEQDRGDSRDAEAVRREIGELRRRLEQLARRYEVQVPEAAESRRREALEQQIRQRELRFDRAGQALEELEEAGEAESPRARELRAQRATLERQINDLHASLDGRRPDPERVRREELARHIEGTAREFDHLGQMLAELEEQGRGDSDQARELRVRRGQLEGRLAELHRARESMDRGPAPEELRRHQQELAERAEGVRRALEAMGDRNPDLSARLEEELHNLEREMERVERAFQDRQGRPDRPELEARVNRLTERVERLGMEMREIRGLLEHLVQGQERRSGDRDVDEEHGDMHEEHGDRDSR